MPKLVLEKNGQHVDEYIISKQDNIIGRSVGCDMSIADESISRKHLRIICILGDCFLEDLNSANGTLVNGKLTQKCPLEDGDSILIGQHEIKYDAVEFEQSTADTSEDDNHEEVETGSTDQDTEEITSTDSESLDATVRIDPETLDLDQVASRHGVSEAIEEEAPEDAIETSSDEDSDPDSEASTRSRTKAENPDARIGNLKIISGRKQGQTISLHKSVTGIDKGGKRIAAVNRREDGYFLVPVVDEQGIKVQVIVNGEEINRRIYPLWSNDIIELGDNQMEFQLNS